MKLLPFNLAVATYKSDAVVTRTGIPARIICTDNEGIMPIIALVKVEGTSVPTPFSYTKDGRYYSDGSESDLDLFILGDDKENLLGEIEDCLFNAFENIQQFYKENKDDLMNRAKQWAGKLLNDSMPEGTLVVTSERLKAFKEAIVPVCYRLLDRIVARHEIDDKAREGAEEIVKELKAVIAGRTKTDSGWPR